MDESLASFVRKYVNDVIDRSIQKLGTSQPDGSRTLQRENSMATQETPSDYTSDVSQQIGQFADDLATDCVKSALGRAIHGTGKKVLCVGIVCLDLISACAKYPDEDTETLVEEHYWSRGGNASNTATVLAHLGARTEFIGTLVESKVLDFLVDDFKKNGVCTDNCVYLEAGKHKFPTSVLVLSNTSGSRTALPDFKGVTELSFEHFDKLDPQEYRWIHFEGRANNPDIPQMMDKVDRYNTECEKEHKVRVSVEIEHPHSMFPGLIRLFPKADVVFVSKDYAVDAGFTTKTEAVQKLYPRCRTGATLICAWGDQGAAAIAPEGECSSPAYPPMTLVDTLGAGDTFNASVIYALTSGATLEQAVTLGCKVAGAKCGCRGFSCVRQFR